MAKIPIIMHMTDNLFIIISSFKKYKMIISLPSKKKYTSVTGLRYSYKILPRNAFVLPLLTLVSNRFSRELRVALVGRLTFLETATPLINSRSLSSASSLFFS
jgi:hypothetical protein